MRPSVRRDGKTSTFRRKKIEKTALSIPINSILFIGIVRFVAVGANWIDPETPESAHTTKNIKPPQSLLKNNQYEESVYTLMMSDEFNVPGRTFEDGADPMWTALDKNDYTNSALHYYSPENAQTDADGNLVITTEAKDTEVIGFNDVKGEKEIVTKHFRSAMLQTWNKFCFTGGIIEGEAQLPGKPDVGGLWPAFWLLGNMARHTYVGSTNHMWPWSSNICTSKTATAQRINGCLNAVHYGLEPRFGRGAPEIDIFEVQPGPIKHNTGPFLKTTVGQPFLSASYQIAPGRYQHRPGSGWWPGPGQWYKGLTGGQNTSLNILYYGDYNHFFGGKGDGSDDYWSDAISFNHQLYERHFVHKVKYRVEWELPDEEKGSDGYLRWFVDDKFIVNINGTGIVETGLGASISTEPMYIVLNTAVSKNWGFPVPCPPNCDCRNYDCNSSKYLDTCGFSKGFCEMMTAEDPPKYKMNWLRVYQNLNDTKQKIGCSTPERPTKKYIEAHADLYKTENDELPLKPIQVGRGECNPNAPGVTRESCGGHRGKCTAGKVCECNPGWTGPHCLAKDGFDVIDYEKPEGVADLEFTGPIVASYILWVGLCILALLVVLGARMKRKMDGWRPIQEFTY